jgi:hypothetical protein
MNKLSPKKAGFQQMMGQMMESLNMSPQQMNMLIDSSQAVARRVLTAKIRDWMRKKDLPRETIKELDSTTVEEVAALSVEFEDVSDDARDHIRRLLDDHREMMEILEAGRPIQNKRSRA